MSQAQIDAYNKHIRTYECMIFQYWLLELQYKTLEDMYPSNIKIPLVYRY
jgi:hypothetical protein